jgi:U3 small nucleolar RNA-associated protein MPP10
VTIVSNVPSVTIEECAPVNVSETALLAPEEVYDKQRVEVKSQGEMTKQDRNRERRVKKRRQRLAAKEKAKIQKAIERTNPGEDYEIYNLWLPNNGIRRHSFYWSYLVNSCSRLTGP